MPSVVQGARVIPSAARDRLNRSFVAALLGMTVAGCSPKRVDIVEQPPSGFTATARSEPGEKCNAELRQRVADETNYHCEARGRRAVIESRTENMTPEGCVLSVAFSCGTR